MKKTIGVIFEKSDLAVLEQDAKKHGRLVSSHIRYIVQQYLKDKIEDNLDEQTNRS